MSDAHDEVEEAADEVVADAEAHSVQVDGGTLPKFKPEFELERWETKEGPVVGVRYDGPEVASPAERVAYVRAAMEHRGD